MNPTSPSPTPIADDWLEDHFDHLAPEVAGDPHAVFARMRAHCPVTHSDQHVGFWVVTRYDDVLNVAQDWETFSSARGVGVTESTMVVRAIPEHLDPPEHRIFKRLINAHFTAAAVEQYEAPTRGMVTRLIDGFVEAGSCEFMADFARPFPGLAFFELALGAPTDDVERLNDMATAASSPTSPNVREAWAEMFAWIEAFVARRRSEPPRGDVVDAVLTADIDGRPITDEEIIGVIQLLILGGLETTAGALGQFIIRFAREPEIPDLLRRRPELMAAAIEELLRLDPPFVAIGRTATRETEISGCSVGQGEKVLISWASANHDESEFPSPESFDPERPGNRHLAFGAGPHRCAGSNLARLNLRVALEEIVGRLNDIRLAPDAEPIPFHAAMNRAPLRVPITFSPGPRVG
ncbi:MAG: cytochrome P450 [Acidimicrobiia bacterium]